MHTYRQCAQDGTLLDVLQMHYLHLCYLLPQGVVGFDNKQNHLTPPIQWPIGHTTGVMICDIEEEEYCKEQTHDDNWTVKRLEDTCVLEDMIMTL